MACWAETVAPATGCQHLDPIGDVIQQSIDPLAGQRLSQLSESDKEAFVSSWQCVPHDGDDSRAQQMLNSLHDGGPVAIIGTIYDILTGDIEFLPHADACVEVPVPSTDPQTARLREGRLS